MTIQEQFPRGAQVEMTEEAQKMFPQTVKRNQGIFTIVGYSRDGLSLIIKGKKNKHGTSWSARYWRIPQ